MNCRIYARSPNPRHRITSARKPVTNASTPSAVLCPATFNTPISVATYKNGNRSRTGGDKRDLAPTVPG